MVKNRWYNPVGETSFWDNPIHKIFQNLTKRVLAVLADSATTLVCLYDGDLGLRDGLALHFLRRLTKKKGNVVFVHSGQSSLPKGRFPTAGNLVFLGRAELFSGTSFEEEASSLRLVGRLRDSGSSRPNNSLRYRTSRDEFSFTRQIVDERRFNRCVLDYGVLRFREVDGRVLVNIGGIGALGTLGLTMYLFERVARVKLSREIEFLMGEPPIKSTFTEGYVEVCVRVNCGDVEGLSRIMEYASDPTPKSFPFETDRLLAAVGWRSGSFDNARANPTALPWTLRDDPNGTGGYVILHSGKEVKLAKQRYRLVQSLVSGPVQREVLCRRLGYSDKPPWNKNPLTNLISETNKVFTKAGVSVKPIRTVRNGPIVMEMRG